MIPNDDPFADLPPANFIPQETIAVTGVSLAVFQEKLDEAFVVGYGRLPEPCPKCGASASDLPRKTLSRLFALRGGGILESASRVLIVRCAHEIGGALDALLNRRFDLTIQCPPELHSVEVFREARLNLGTRDKPDRSTMPCLVPLAKMSVTCWQCEDEAVLNFLKQHGAMC